MSQLSLERLTWIAAGLAAGASLLRWLATDTQSTHAWSLGTLVALVAAAAQMTLAVALVGTSTQAGTATGRPTAAGTRTSHAVYLIGALVSAAILLAFVPALFPGDAEGSAHGGHGGGAEAVAPLDAVRLSIEVTVTGLLLAMYRATQHPRRGVSG